MSIRINNFTIKSGSIHRPSSIDSYTKVLLRFNGTGGSTTFTDEKGHVFTPYGNAKISMAQSKFGGSSGEFDGNCDSIKTPYVANDFNLSTADFTLETWAYFRTVTQYRMLVGRWSGVGVNYEQCYALRAGPSGRYSFVYTVDGVNNNAIEMAGTGSITLNVWQHWAVSRQGSTLRLFIDGNCIVSGSISGGNIYNSNVNGFTVGGANNNTDCSDVYLDDLRLSVGIARYTSNFIPPAAL